MQRTVNTMFATIDMASTTASMTEFEPIDSGPDELISSHGRKPVVDAAAAVVEWLRNLVGAVAGRVVEFSIRPSAKRKTSWCIRLHCTAVQH